MVQKESMRATLVEMEPQDVVSIPLEARKYNYVRNCASILGLQLSRRYSVSLDRESRCTKVTRLS